MVDQIIALLQPLNRASLIYALYATIGMPTIEENRYWDSDYDWEKDGDEWSDQAAYCRKDYQDWKESIVKHFIIPYLGQDMDVLEISPGHGRWTPYLLKGKSLVLVDMNPKCIEFCRKRFFDENIRFHVNDGRKLDRIDDDTIDFVWSYDSFVHMEHDVVESYCQDFSRILRKGGKAVIHHAGRNDMFLRLGFLKRWKTGRKAYQMISMNKLSGEDGWRSDVSKESVRRIAKRSGLIVDSQVNSWGDGYNNRLFNDWVSILCKKEQSI